MSISQQEGNVCLITSIASIIQFYRLTKDVPRQIPSRAKVCVIFCERSPDRESKLLPYAM